MRVLLLVICAGCLSTEQDVSDRLESLEDRDGDGYIDVAYGGDDCDDQDARVYPGAYDFWYDGVDSDCMGDSDYDADRDGYDADAFGGLDCDDKRPEVNPGELEYCDGGLDNDCDPETVEQGCE